MWHVDRVTHRPILGHLSNFPFITTTYCLFPARISLSDPRAAEAPILSPFCISLVARLPL